jgi:hypothetical protein
MGTDMDYELDYKLVRLHAIREALFIHYRFFFFFFFLFFTLQFLIVYCLLCVLIARIHGRHFFNKTITSSLNAA